MIVLAMLIACGGPGAPAVDVVVEPQPVFGAECAVCGMMVAEQPAPRGQVVYRDRTHAHFCSIGDLRASLQAPSPHGKATHVYVEALPAAVDPALTNTAPLPWVDAQQAWFVFGAERPLVMGLPVLSFADSEAANAVAKRLGQPVVRWPTVIDTPFHTLPK